MVLAEFQFRNSEVLAGSCIVARNGGPPAVGMRARSSYSDPYLPILAGHSILVGSIRQTLAGHQLDILPILLEKPGRLVNTWCFYFNATSLPSASVRYLKMKRVVSRLCLFMNGLPVAAHFSVPLYCVELTQSRFPNWLFVRRQCGVGIAETNNMCVQQRPDNEVGDRSMRCLGRGFSDRSARTPLNGKCSRMQRSCRSSCHAQQPVNRGSGPSCNSFKYSRAYIDN
jgi:hypothetical protein